MSNFIGRGCIRSPRVRLDRAMSKHSTATAIEPVVNTPSRLDRIKVLCTKFHLSGDEYYQLEQLLFARGENDPLVVMENAAEAAMAELQAQLKARLEAENKKIAAWEAAIEASQLKAGSVVKLVPDYPEGHPYHQLDAESMSITSRDGKRLEASIRLFHRGTASPDQDQPPHWERYHKGLVVYFSDHECRRLIKLEYGDEWRAAEDQAFKTYTMVYFKSIRITDFTKTGRAAHAVVEVAADVPRLGDPVIGRNHV